jgi:rRNA maturation endonuclease Nob1
MGLLDDLDRLPVPPVREDAIHRIACAVCRKVFKAHYKTKYCGAACVLASRRRRRAVKTNDPMIPR